MPVVAPGTSAVGAFKGVRSPPVSVLLGSAGTGIVVDTVAQGHSSGVSVASQSWSHTVANGQNLLLLVAVAYVSTVTCASVTYGGVPLTQLDTSRSPAMSTARNLDFWFLVAPAVGTANVVATLSAPAAIVGESVGLMGVDQAAPLRATAKANTNTVSTLTATTAAGAASDLVIAGAAIRTTSTPTYGAPQSEIYGLLSGTNLRVAGTRQAGSATLPADSTFTWTTADSGAIIAVPVKAA